MDANELINEIKKKTFPRIRDLMALRYKEATMDEQIAESFSGWDAIKPSEPAEIPPEIFWRLLDAPLKDLAVHLLWTMFAAKTGDTFIISKKSVDKVVASIDEKEVVRVTGFKPEDAVFVIKQMAESLVEVVREHSVIYIEMDRQPFRLCMFTFV
jgi:hypothetical protein